MKVNIRNRPMDPSRESANKKIFTQFSPLSPKKTHKFPPPYVQRGPRPVNYPSHPGVLPGCLVGRSHIGSLEVDGLLRRAGGLEVVDGWLAGRINWCNHLTFLKNHKQLIQDKSSASWEMNDRDLEVRFLFHVDIDASLVNFVAGIRDL